MQKRNREKTALDNKTDYTVVCCILYNIQPGNLRGPYSYNLGGYTGHQNLSVDVAAFRYSI